MSVTIDQVMVRCRVSRDELDLWVARKWVRAVRTDAGLSFSEPDVARIEMISDLVRDIGLDENAMDVILPLVDQLYAVRRSLRAMTEAVGELPEETRRQVLDEIARRARR